MDRPPADDRSLLAAAYSWATTIMVIASEMVIPGLIGLWLGKMLGLGAMIAFASIGFTFGLIVSVRHLMRLANAQSKTNSPSAKEPPQS